MTGSKLIHAPMAVASARPTRARAPVNAISGKNITVKPSATLYKSVGIWRA
jgi:hypothetical protein